jgi:8-oxo-(d)GTP phosphatase
VASGLEAPPAGRRRRVALTELVRAAGGILRRVSPNGVEVLLVHRPRYDDWTFPKGKAHPGESDEETAVREVEEETGLNARLGVELPSTRYRDSRGRPKVVRYWTMRPESGSFEPHDEIDEIRWVPVAEAPSALSYERDRDVLDALPQPLLVNRHASAGDAKDWAGPDSDRPLDPRGHKQAEALVDQLKPFPIRRIVSSPFVRCVGTMEPLARARGLEVERSEALAEGADPKVVRRLLVELGSEAVVCMHRPELEPLFGKVKKGATVAVEVAGDELRELGRLPPPA